MVYPPSLQSKGRKEPVVEGERMEPEKGGNKDVGKMQRKGGGGKIQEKQ